jgi:hypothetical protein
LLKGRKNPIIHQKISQVLVAHACNPSYSGGRDQEDHSSKPARANSLQDPISKKPITKRAGVVAQTMEYYFFMKRNETAYMLQHGP